MTVPGRRDAARLLISLEPSAKFVNHSCAVADIAAWLAMRAAANGSPVDVNRVAVAALLHDVDKLGSVTAPGHLRHGEGGAAWLADHGMAELAPLVRDHPVTCLVEPAAATRLAGGPLEARIIAYADKRAAQQLEPMRERFARWRRKYPPGSGTRVARTGGIAWDEATIALIEARAAALERDVCAAAGARPDEVSRLRWARRALREARAAGSAEVPR